ncbi:hypothetical protein BDF19DRAFT_432755 [Syncephalis fuscata]|nr:hypothetical protein BDF19DRAFT_432755 [Syncephalis fuscata]
MPRFISNMLFQRSRNDKESSALSSSSSNSHINNNCPTNDATTILPQIITNSYLHNATAIKKNSCFGINSLPSPKSVMSSGSSNNQLIPHSHWANSELTDDDNDRRERDSLDSSATITIHDECRSFDSECSEIKTPHDSPKMASRGRRLLSKASCGLLRLGTASATSLASTTASAESSVRTAASPSVKPNCSVKFYSLPTKRFGLASWKRNGALKFNGQPRKSRSLDNLQGRTRRSFCPSKESETDNNEPDTNHFRWSRLRETVFLYDPALMSSSQPSRSTRDSNPSEEIDVFYHEFVLNSTTQVVYSAMKI